jgi:DNA-binding winged helix-turn-helix (wHTH) protein/predicted ATPase
VKLPPKALAVLWTLASRPGHVITKAALLDAIWGETVVGEDALAFQVQVLRQALGDDARRPRYIETVHRVGYRFLTPVTTAPPPPGLPPRAPPAGTTPFPDAQPSAPTLVGRESELARLDELLARVLDGARRVAFVTGEAGIGKTALVETFLAGRSGGPALSVGRGQCVEHYGPGEAYLPLLEALGRLGRGAGGERVLEILRRHAPSWLAQLPALSPRGDIDALRRQSQSVTRARMQRELVEGLEALSIAQPVVLLLEDLHWGDPSTVEWLAMVARRGEAARLLVLGTYRPVDLIVAGHGLKAVKHELVARGQAVEVALGPLSPEAVRTFVAQRLARPAADEALATFVYRRTEGHPLFMVQVTDYLAQLDVGLASPAPSAPGAPAIEQAVPERLRELIEAQLERLPAEAQQVLEVASVAGAEFAVASVAAGAQTSADVVEAVCEGLARQGQFLEDRGLARWPDGTVGGRYAFRHALHQEVLYARLGPGQRARLHMAIGGRKAAGYGGAAGDIAAELARHFAEGRDVSQAVHYHRAAAEKALRRHAYTEVLAHVDKGLSLLPLEADGAPPVREELLLHLARGAALLATKGFGAPEIEPTYARARRLSQALEDVPALVTALYRLWDVHVTRAELAQARSLADQLFALAQGQPDPTRLLLAYNAAGWTALFAGVPVAARAHFERSAALYDQEAHRSVVAVSGVDAGVSCASGAALTCWLLGYPSQAEQHLDRGKALADALAYPLGIGLVRWTEAVIAHQRGDPLRVQDTARQLVSLCLDYGIPFWLPPGRILQGWADVRRGSVEDGIGLIREGMGGRATGTEITRPYALALLADACMTSGRVEDAREPVGEALERVRRTGERWYEPELHRLAGELALATGRAGPPAETARRGRSTPLRAGACAEAETCFEQALALAHEQQARLFELRAALSLARLPAPAAKRQAARRRLAEVYAWFSEGFELPDLVEARGFLGA